jgi:NTP pyrophosphatase (non-canonical NTP hydrolase)
MEGSEYQKLAMRTAALSLEKDREKGLVTAALGLFGEGGEVVDLVKKHYAQGHDLPKDKLVKELGDCYWYVARGFTAIELEIGNELHVTPEYDYFDAMGSNQLVRGCLLLSKSVGDFSDFVDIDTCFNGVEQDTFYFVLVDIANHLYTICKVLGVTIDEVLEANITKLKDRYPDGFKVEQSVNRAD